MEYAHRSSADYAVAGVGIELRMIIMLNWDLDLDNDWRA